LRQKTSFAAHCAPTVHQEIPPPPSGEQHNDP
jgi:hypothetical protein